MVLLLPLGAFANGKEVVILGDSLVAGYGLSPEAGLVPQLQAWLDRRNSDVILTNAGVSGDTSAGGLARLDWALSPDVDGLVVSLGANDMLRGIPPKEARANLQAIVEKAENLGLPVLLVGFQAPANWGPDYVVEFDAIYPELANMYDTLLVPSFFGPLSADGSTFGASAFLQPDGLHPNPEGVLKVVAEIGPYLLALRERIQ